MTIKLGSKVKFIKLHRNVIWTVLRVPGDDQFAFVLATNARAAGWTSNMLDDDIREQMCALGLNPEEHAYWRAIREEFEVISELEECERALFDEISNTKESTSTFNYDADIELNIKELKSIEDETTNKYYLSDILSSLYDLDEEDLLQVKSEIAKVEKEFVNKSIDNHIVELNKLLSPIVEYIENMNNNHGIDIEYIEFLTLQKFKAKYDGHEDVKFIDFD